ncbi:MAG TPA: carotenoid oxygenase family protein [Caulobacteraceae bacterium]|nr:carotenoid oxygenase family protein [Caulobacteraceae bacterium]
MDGSQPINPYMAGNFAPVRTEDDFDLEVTGALPSELRGAFYRNGPNPQFDPGPDHHWFFGDGMVHAFFVEDGKVRYRNRYVRTPKWLLENEAGRRLFGVFGNPMTTDPAAIGKDGGVANTNIVWHGGRLLALEEGHPPTELDPATLETMGYRAEYRGKVTAHPKMDPKTGEMVWFAYSAGPAPLNPTLAYGVTDKDGNLLRRDDFEAPYTSMVHDFLVTDHYALFPVLPLTGSLERAMRGGPAFAWEPQKGAFVGVMRRDAGVDTVRWFETDPAYVFHPMNAFEADGKICADVMEYPFAPLFPNPDGSPGGNVWARLVRWTFDLASNSNRIRRQVVDDMAGEFPRFDERHAGLGYRHGWFAANTRESGPVAFNAIAHVDLKTGARKVFQLPAGDVAGEPIFVPRTESADEGDGYLLALVYRGDEDRSDFLVFDALGIEAGPIATAKLPRRVPFGFHGNWRPS